VSSSKNPRISPWISSLLISGRPGIIGTFDLFNECRLYRNITDRIPVAYKTIFLPNISRKVGSGDIVGMFY
jgi:hypothetical protein